MYLNISMELESTTSPYTWVIIYSTLLIILAREMEQIKNRYQYINCQQEVIWNDKQSTSKSGLKEVKEETRGNEKKDSRERNQDIV